MEDEFDYSEPARSAPSHRHMYVKEEKSPIPLVYSSLPPTPISTSPPPRSLDLDQKTEPPLSPTYTVEFADEIKPLHNPPFSLWDYLQEELLATDFDSHQELKWERVSNFLSIPLAMEKVCF